MPRTCIPAATYVQNLSSAIRSLPIEPMELLANDLMDAWHQQRFIFTCGNGGSAANGSHFVEDIGKCTIPRLDESAPRFRTISLSENTPYILAWANDDGFDRIYVEQLINLASPGDVLIAFSTSGRSQNVLQAMDWARSNGLVTWAMSGSDDSPLVEVADNAIQVPSQNVGIVETAHLAVIHWLVDELQVRLEQVVHSGAA